MLRCSRLHCRSRLLRQAFSSGASHVFRRCSDEAQQYGAISPVSDWCATAAALSFATSSTVSVSSLGCPCIRVRKSSLCGSRKRLTSLWTRPDRVALSFGIFLYESNAEQFGRDEPPPSSSAGCRAEIRQCLLRSTVLVGGGRPRLAFGVNDKWRDR